MKAIVLTKYGSPTTLQLKELPIPTPEKKEVLIRVHATAVNDYDWSLVRGKPYPYRLLFGLFQPKGPIPGIEFAGIIEALGEEVNAFNVGDAVYGDLSDYSFGTFAEYICVKEKALAPKPDHMTFEQAAATPHAVLLAYQGLVDIGKIKPKQQILINGAGGGMGTFALQLAKLYEAEVTGVDSDDKLGMMKRMGFDHLIDYKKEDFTKNGQQYDLILDAKTNRPPFAYLRSLKPEGRYVTVGGQLGRLFQLFISKAWISKRHSKSLHILGLKPNKGLDHINQLFEEGKIKPLIDGPYTLEEIPRLLQYFGDGKHKGKVVVSIPHPAN